MRNTFDLQTLLSAVTAGSATFTAKAATDTFTSNNHGLSNGDMITVGSDDTLPSPLVASLPYFVINAATNTFQVSLTTGGSAVDITDTGTGTHTWYKAYLGKSILVENFQFGVLQLGSSGNCDFKIKFQGSVSNDAPNFSYARSVSNHWDYIDVIDLEDGVSIDGDAGISLTGTDDFRQFQMNVDGLKWLNCFCFDGTSGSLTVKIKLFEDLPL
jgi:hypothetical protein